MACGGSIPLIGKGYGENIEFDGPLGSPAGGVAQDLAAEEAKTKAREDLNRMISMIRCDKGCKKTISKITVTVTETWATSLVDLFLVSWEKGYARAQATATVSCSEAR